MILIVAYCCPKLNKTRRWCVRVGESSNISQLSGHFCLHNNGQFDFYLGWVGPV